MYAMREMLDNLRLGEIATALEEQCDGELHVSSIVEAYDRFAQIVECLLDDMTAMIVRLSCKNGKIQMSMQVGCSRRIPEYILSKISCSNGTIQCQVDEEDAMVQMVIEERGDDR